MTRPILAAGLLAGLLPLPLAAADCDAILGLWEARTWSMTEAGTAHMVTDRVMLAPRHGLACQFAGFWQSWQEDTESIAMIEDGIVTEGRISFARIGASGPERLDGRMTDDGAVGTVLDADGATIAYWSLSPVPSATPPNS